VEESLACNCEKNLANENCSLQSWIK